MLNVLNADDSVTAVKVTDKRPEEARRMKQWLDGRIAASKEKPSAEVISLTPVLAQLLLDRNHVNRPTMKRNSADLASDIASGRFEFNGESIVVSRTGILLDGQHRCQQVVSTGKSIETVIVFGPKEAARFTIDTGKSKTVTNFLAMKGRTYVSILGPAVNYYLQWSRNGFIDVTGNHLPTKAEILAAADELKGIDRSVETTYGAVKTVRSNAVLAFCHYAFKKKAGAEAADEFMGHLIDGDNLKKGAPILYCRNRLLSFGSEVRANVRIELVFKCWNAWRRSDGVDHCKLTGGRLPKIEA